MSGAIADGRNMDKDVWEVEYKKDIIKMKLSVCDFKS